MPPEGEQSNFERSDRLWRQNCGGSPRSQLHIESLTVEAGL